MQFIVDLWLDGYETEDEQKAACKEFILEQLSATASSVEVREFEASKTHAEYAALRAGVEKLPNSFKHCTEENYEKAKAKVLAQTASSPLLASIRHLIRAVQFNHESHHSQPDFDTCHWDICSSTAVLKVLLGYPL